MNILEFHIMNNDCGWIIDGKKLLLELSHALAIQYGKNTLEIKR